MTGGKMNSIQNAHDFEEITAACIENRRLFTGARNGTIKVLFYFALKKPITDF